MKMDDLGVPLHFRETYRWAIFAKFQEGMIHSEAMISSNVIIAIASCHWEIPQVNGASMFDSHVGLSEAKWYVTQ